MPRINRETGEISDQRRDWFDTHRTVYQDCSTGVCKIVLSDGTEVAPRAANEVYGSGSGDWVAWLSTAEGVFTSRGKRYGGWTAGPMGPDGSFVTKVHDSYGPTYLMFPNESLWKFTEGDAYNAQPRGGSAISWIDPDGRPHDSQHNTPARKVWWLRYASGHWLFQDRETGQLCIDDRAIKPVGDYFYPDMAIFGDLIVVTWSPNQADTNVQTKTIRIGELGSYPPIGEAPKPPEPPKEKPVEISAEKWEAIKALRGAFPTPLGDRHGEFLLRCCQIVGDRCGLLRKSSGSFVVLINGERVSQDYLLFPNGMGVDFLGDGEGLATVQPGALHQEDASKYLDVSGLLGNPPAEPPPPPPPPTEPPPEVSLYNLGKHLGAWK